MVEVFKTNIAEENIAAFILKTLLSYLPNSNINFDLEDCDNILRIENCSVKTDDVIAILKENGYQCELLA